MLFSQLSLAEKADAVSSRSGSGWIGVRVRRGGCRGGSWFLCRRRSHRHRAESSADALGLWDHKGSKSLRLELALFCWCFTYLWISQLC